jgi:hypothetical protein
MYFNTFLAAVNLDSNLSLHTRIQQMQRKFAYMKKLRPSFCKLVLTYCTSYTHKNKHNCYHILVHCPLFAQVNDENCLVSIQLKTSLYKSCFRIFRIKSRIDDIWRSSLHITCFVFYVFLKSQLRLMKNNSHRWDSNISVKDIYPVRDA